MSLVLSLLWQHLRRYPRIVVAYLFLTTAMIGTWVLDPFLGQTVIDSISLLDSKTFSSERFLPLAGLWVGVSVLLCILQALHHILVWRAMNRTYVDFIADSYDSVLQMDVAHHVQRRAGAIIKKIDNAGDVLWDLGYQFFEVIVPTIISGVIFLVISFAVSWTLASLITLSMVLYAFVLWRVTKRAEPFQKTVSRVWVSIIGRAYDVATNILPVKSAPAEAREVKRMRMLQRRAFRLQVRADYLWGFLEGLNMFILLRVMIVGIGIVLVSRNFLTLGQLFFFLFITFRLISPIEVIGNVLPKWNEKLEKLRMGIQMRSLPSRVQNAAKPVIIEELRGEIRFVDASFSYEESGSIQLAEEELEEELDILDPHGALDADESSEGKSSRDIRHTPRHPEIEAAEMPAPSREIVEPRAALKELNFTIHPGEHIALVGHSGAGKSTIASLLNRFYDLTEGSILVDGVDLRQLDVHWWRGQIGLVLQDNTMFNDSILENIRYARPDATEAEVIGAAKRAHVHEFVSRFPKKYKTTIGERGIRLSGGERQRVAIARAILKEPAIVILDEATSALDSVTEKAVQEGIRELIKGRTSFIIAHRLSTVRSVDRIAVLDEGRLIAIAPHEELLTSCPIYREMVELQSHGMLAE